MLSLLIKSIDVFPQWIVQSKLKLTEWYVTPLNEHAQIWIIEHAIQLPIRFVNYLQVNQQTFHFVLVTSSIASNVFSELSIVRFSWKMVLIHSKSIIEKAHKKNPIFSCLSVSLAQILACSQPNHILTCIRLMTWIHINELVTPSLIDTASVSHWNVVIL